MAKKQILIVDDDNALCSLLEGILKRNYIVKTLNTSEDAWFWLTDGNEPQLIITDFKMPGLNGMEFIENIRTSSLFAHIPVILLSGYTGIEIESACNRWHVSAKITKPFKPQILLETTEAVINR